MSRRLLSVEQLEDRVVPTRFDGGVTVAFGDFNSDGRTDVVTAIGSGESSLVKVTTTDNDAELVDFAPFNMSFRGGSTVATGDVNHDGVVDLITGAGAGSGPHVRVWSGANGSELFSFFAYDPDFRGGITTASADVNGDGYSDIVTGAGSGGGPHVKVFSGLDGAEIASFMALESTFLGGVSVAAGDFDHDGLAEIIVGAGAGAEPTVKIFSGRTLTEMNSLAVYSPLFLGGVRVAVGDVNGDGTLDLITGAGMGGGPHVQVFDGQTLQVVQSFYAYSPEFRGGVWVGAGDVNGDGRAEVVTGAGVGGGPHVRVWDSRDLFNVVDWMAFDPEPGFQPAHLVPGVPGSTTTVVLNFDGGDTDYKSEYGIFRVDGPRGDVDGITPGSPGYAEAALAGSRRSVIVDAEGLAAPKTEVPLPAGSHFGFYVIQDASYAAWQAHGGGNSTPVYFSFPNANLDHYDHSFRLPGSKVEFEDLTGGGDEDFNDFIASIQFRLADGTVVNPVPPVTPPTVPPVVPPVVPPPPVPINLDLAGWTIAETGGSTGNRGTVTGTLDGAVLREGNSFTTTLSRSFVVPTSASVLSFAFSSMLFDQTDTGFVHDAFEVALLDERGRPLVDPISSGRDAYYNRTEGRTPAVLGKSTTASGDTVTVDLSSVAAGTTATLVFRLVNNDRDTGSTITIRSVNLPSTEPAPSAVKFFVVDPTTNTTFRYGVEGLTAGRSDLAPVAGNARGVASNPAGDTVWIVDATTKQINVFDADGVAKGAWTATDAVNPVGVTVQNGDLWLVDSGTHRVSRYIGGAGHRGGTALASSSFALDGLNDSPSDLVTDGTTIWVTDDATTKVYVYDVAGMLLGNWRLDLDNASPSGVTINPSGGNELWVVDRLTRQVYRYADGRTLRSGMATAANTFQLDASNTAPEGIADPPPRGDGFPDYVIDFFDAGLGPIPGPYGRNKNGPANVVVDPSIILGAPSPPPRVGWNPETDWLALPTNSYVTVGFTDEVIIDGPGNDIFIRSLDAEDSAGECAKVYVSANGKDFVFLGVAAQGGNVGLDLGTIGFTLPVTAVRIVGIDQAGASPGFDLVSIEVLPSSQSDPLIPPTLTVVSTGGAFDAGSELVLSGEAKAFGLLPFGTNRIATVTVDGSPVEVLDASGRFFTRISVASGVNSLKFVATDAAGQQVTSMFSISGVQREPGIVDFSQFTDLTSSFVGEYSRTSFDTDSKTLFADVAVRNLGQYPANVPLYVGVKNISDPAVQVQQSAGTLPDGTPYYDFTGLVSAGMTRLDPDAVTGTVSLTFANPHRSRFTYDLVFLGVLNRGPTITSLPKLEAPIDRIYRYAAKAVDPDQDTLTYSLGTAPVGMSIDSTTGAITWTATSEQKGNHQVTLVVSDGRGGTATQSFTVVADIAPPNRPPVFTSTPILDAEVGEAYTYQAFASDADDDTLTYSLSGSVLAGMQIDSASGRITWTPTVAQRDDQTVSIIATDGNGDTATQTYSICVKNSRNRAPVIVSEPVTSVTITNLILADSVSEFSSKQGQSNWYYGYYDSPNENVVDPHSFQSFTQFVPDGHPIVGDIWWQQEGSYWTSLWATGGHANGYSVQTTPPRVRDATWSVRRWSSEYTGKVNITGRVAKLGEGDSVGANGFVARILLNGLEKWSQYIGGTDRIGRDYTVTLDIVAGDKLDFAIDPLDGNDHQDSSVFTANVSRDAEASDYQYRVMAIDGNNNQLAYSLPVAPAGMTIDPATGLVSWKLGSGRNLIQNGDFSSGKASRKIYLPEVALILS